MMVSVKKKYALLILVLFLAASICYFQFRDPVLAKVGTIKIHKSEVLYRDKVILLAFPEEKRSLGLHQLVKSAINQEILKNNSIIVTDAAIEQEQTRIDQNTKNAAELDNAKKIFGENIEAYRRVYVLPTLVDRVIYYEFFLTDEKIHAAEVKKALDFIALVQGKEKDFRSIAQKNGFNPLEIKKVVVSLKEGLIWPEVDIPGAPKRQKHAALQKTNPALDIPGSKPDSEEAKKWFEIFDKNLKVGDVAPVPISYGESLLVAHYLKKISPTQMELEVVIIPKLQYGPWFDSERAKVPVEIYDKTAVIK